MALTTIQRALGIMSLVKGPAANTGDTVGSMVGEISGSLANEWGERFYEIGSPVSVSGVAQTWDQLTNEQKGTYFVNAIRSHFRNVAKAANVPSTVESARTSAISESNTTTTTDLGNDE
jgi:hypothetical protein